MTKLLVAALLAHSLSAAAPAAGKYDPSRDAASDIEQALSEAKRSGRRVLLEVGGEWCVWCHRLDTFLEKNKSIGDLWRQTFVVVKVNFSDENRNEKALGKYPKIPGYPHFFVLERDGTLLSSQSTDELEDGPSYDPGRFRAFIESWRVP